MTNNQMAALVWAVGMAEDWRGSLVGDPDPVPLQMFDVRVKLARAALGEVRDLRREMRRRERKAP